MTIANTDTFISVAEAARRVGVSELTIRRLIATDRLLAVRPEGVRRVLVSEDSLASLLIREAGRTHTGLKTGGKIRGR